MADSGGALILMFGLLVFLLLVVGISYWLFKSRGSGEGMDSAMEELRRQYAQGDIDDTEFESRREKLRQY